MNPARNAYEIVLIRNLKTCNRCGEKNLAWVKLASGRWALVHTSTVRPVYTGQNQAPEAQPGYVYANKLRFHRCGEVRMLDLYTALDDAKADAYRNLNNYIYEKYGKNASVWPAAVAEELEALIVKIEHIMRAAQAEVPKFFDLEAK